ncbi:MAG: Oligopeptide-binding protein AppA [Paracidovorax wautersii]|uniref:Oligopeptide-binding protein AppA n=1 Tax=Paracidovorax wautersii TaxID=1177982 RepID=A0A7V8FQQ2_9BURK|nr:MAG: Oligopeptide-binding protein AppA [Paracidovorax wautersii]
MTASNTALPSFTRRRLNAGLAALAGLSALPAYAQSAAPVAPATPRVGGTLRWALLVEPPTLVPINTTAGGPIDIGPKVVEGLLRYDAQPLLATAWEISPDGLRYTFRLRQGVKWHDDHPFTSADVAYAIGLLKQFHPRGRATFAQVREVRTPDAHTAVLLLDKPAPYLLTALASAESPIVPRHLYEGRDLASNPYNRAPVGTGPFRFKEWVKGSHITLVRNPDYWDAPRPYLDQIVGRFITDAPARAAALEAGDIDIAGNAVPVGELDRFAQLPALRIDNSAWPYQGQHNQIVLNHETPALQKREVRLAIAQAISIEGVNKLAWFGKGVPSATAIGVASRFHDASIAFHRFDPAGSERLLDQAGLPRAAGGRRLALRLASNPYTDRRIADIVRQSLQKIGIDAVLREYDFGTYVNKVYTERDFDITVESQSNLFDPTVGVQRLYWSKNFQIGLPFSTAGHYVNAEVDRLLEAAAVEPDEARRRALFAQFQKAVWDDVAAIDIGKPPETVITSRRLGDDQPSAERLYGSFAGLHFTTL